MLNPVADANKKTVKGFSLIELMMTVALIGVLATLALPAYDTLVIEPSHRKAVTKLLLQCQLEIEQSIRKNNALPAHTDNVVAECPTRYPEDAADGDRLYIISHHNSDSGAVNTNSITEPAYDKSGGYRFIASPTSKMKDQNLLKIDSNGYKIYGTDTSWDNI